MTDFSFLNQAAPSRLSYTVFDVRGNVARSGFGVSSLQEVAVVPGEVVVPGEFSTATHYFKDGAVREYTEAQRAAKASLPDDASYWDNTTMVWVSTVDPAIRTAEKWVEVRQIRDAKLVASDWSVLPDVPMDTAKRGEWAAYRQALRDITAQPDPFNIVWPTPPV